MFIDYYEVLEIKSTASIEEVKAAFKMQALKWHPDRNLGVDTTLRMQLINEAYLILKDVEARQNSIVNMNDSNNIKDRKNEQIKRRKNRIIKRILQKKRILIMTLTLKMMY